MIIRARRPIIVASRPTTPLVPSATGDQARPLVASIADTPNYLTALRGAATMACSRLQLPPAPPVPVASRVSEFERPGHPGAAARSISTPLALPPGALLPKPITQPESERPGHPGSAQWRGTMAPPSIDGFRLAIMASEHGRTGHPGTTSCVHSIALAMPPGNLLPKAIMPPEPERPGYPGSALCWGTKAPLPICGLRLAIVASPFDSPGNPGRVDVIVSRAPPVYPQTPRTASISEREPHWLTPPTAAKCRGQTDPLGQPSRVVFELERPGRPGSAVSLSSPPNPIVFLPTGHRLTIRDIELAWTPSPATRSRSLAEHPRPIAGQAAAIDTPLPFAGFVQMGRLYAPPDPRPTTTNVGQLGECLIPTGSWKAIHSIDFAPPAGALKPRVVVIGELQQPGYPGLARRSMAAHDYTLVVPDPLFLSESPATFRAWRS